MNKTILTLILFITSLTLTFAQEKQNDATLEETVNWINEIAIPKQLNTSDMKGVFLTNVYVDINKKVISYYGESKKYGDSNDFPKFNDHDRIWVGYSGDSFKIQIVYNRDKSNDYNFSIIRFSDKEMARRTYNAFSHLFKLLNIEIKRYNKLANENKF